MSDNNGDFGAFLAGFMIGGLVGAAVALLMAPQSGEETRTLIRDKSIELKDKATETAEEARHRAEKALEEARARAEAAYQDVRVRADEVASLTKEKATQLQERGTIVLEEQKTKLEDAIQAGKKAAQKKRDDLTGSKASDAADEKPAAA